MRTKNIIITTSLLFAGSSAALATSYICRACPGGTYNDGTQKECKQCEAGTYAQAASEKCTLCPKGKYATAGASECKDCKASTEQYYVEYLDVDENETRKMRQECIAAASKELNDRLKQCERFSSASKEKQKQEYFERQCPRSQFTSECIFHRYDSNARKWIEEVNDSCINSRQQDCYSRVSNELNHRCPNSNYIFNYETGECDYKYSNPFDSHQDQYEMCLQEKRDEFVRNSRTYSVDARSGCTLGTDVGYTDEVVRLIVGFYHDFYGFYEYNNSSNDVALESKCQYVGKCIKKRKYGATCGPLKKETTAYCQKTGSISAEYNPKVIKEESAGNMVCSGQNSCRMYGVQEQYIGSCQGCGTPRVPHSYYANSTCEFTCEYGYTKIDIDNLIGSNKLTPNIVKAPDGGIYSGSNGYTRWHSGTNSNGYSRYGSYLCCKVAGSGALSMWDCYN